METIEITAEQVIQKMDKIRNRVLSGTAQAFHFRNHWGPEFALKEVHRSFSKEKDLGFAPVETLTIEEIKAVPRSKLYGFGFGNWDDTSLLLIPLWLVSFMEQDLEVTSISGKQSTLGKCDKDVRGGCIAFGIHIN